MFDSVIIDRESEKLDRVDKNIDSKFSKMMHFSL